MTIICEACDGTGGFASFLCGPADPEAPLTGEMACDGWWESCRACSGTGRMTQLRHRAWSAALALTDTHLSSVSALARARSSWRWSKQP